MSVFKSFSLMSILTLSRILGYARDLLFAFIFGASSSADSFLLAFRLPNLFRGYLRSYKQCTYSSLFRY